MITREDKKPSTDTTPAGETTLSAFSLFARDYQQVAIGTLADYLPNASIVALARTSRLFHSVFQPLSDQRRTPRVDHLISLIVNSNQDDAEAIVSNNPSLLRYPGSTDVTAFQQAIMLKDGMMWQMLSAYFDKLKDGEKERRRQFYDILPSGRFQDGKPYQVDHLIQLISGAKPEDLAAVIALKSDSSPLSRGLEHFRYYFDRRIAKEKHFNPQHLIAAEEAFNKIALKDTWSVHQRNVFCVFVLGYMQSRLPLNQLQAFCSEFHKNDHDTKFNGGIEFHRSLICRFEKCNQAPLISNQPKGLGYEYMINFFQANFITYYSGRSFSKSSYAQFIESLTSALQTLKMSIDEPLDKPLNEAHLQKKHSQSPHCAIM
jgi:hypothetical protein